MNNRLYKAIRGVVLLLVLLLAVIVFLASRQPLPEIIVAVVLVATVIWFLLGRE